jgi:hypothetical protein
MTRVIVFGRFRIRLAAGCFGLLGAFKEVIGWQDQYLIKPYSQTSQITT